MKTYPLTFDQVLNLLRLNPEMRFQGEDYQDGASINCTEGVIMLSLYNREFNHFTNFDFVLTPKVNRQMYRSVLTTDELFSS